jgi:Apea-like HEPN
MHPEAKNRMHQLAMGVLDGLVVGEGQVGLNTAGSHAALPPLTKFIEENFGEWVDGDFAFVDVLLTTEEVLRDLGLLSQPGPLKDVISPEQRQLAAQRTVDFWNAVPREYEFFFPLPAFAFFDSEIEIAPGIKLSNAPAERVDYHSMGLQPITGLGLGVVPAPQPPIPCLVVKGKGLMTFPSASDPAAAVAIRRAKAIIQLGKVEDIFTSAVNKFRPPQYIDHLPNTSNEVVVAPAGLAGALVRLTVKPIGVAQPGMSLKERLATVGVIVARESHWDPAKKQASRKEPEVAQAQFDRHCARIVNAAEWLFDASHEQPSATSFVQTAIGFEALYGGAKGEPVIETLANRVAYSLGTSPQSRELLVETFTDFYDTRSKVVHSGATRLSVEQRRRLSRGQAILMDALRHELHLVSQGGAELHPAIVSG